MKACMKAWITTLLLLMSLALQAAPKYEEVDWIELMPKDEVDALMNQQSMPVDHMNRGEQQGSFNTVPGMDKKKVRLAGYIVPIEQNDAGEVTEFFLVPYFGACIHVPPPPPNNIIFVKVAKPVGQVDMFNAFWVEGTLNIERYSNEIAATAYTLSADSVKLYE
jgi:uncharacterized protein